MAVPRIVRPFARSWIAVPAFLAVALAAQGQPRVRSYQSSMFGYRLQFPARWKMVVQGNGVLTLFNYRQSEAGPQGLFPSEGAEIYLIPFETVRAVVGTDTMDGWAKRNLTPGHTNGHIGRFPDVGTTRDVPRDVVEVDADFLRDPQDADLQYEVSYYFALNGAKFRLMLLYWKGNKRGSHLRSVAELVLQSIRSTK